MERNLQNENFEDFLKQNAEGLRMLPSDSVWKGISNHFRRQRRKGGLLIGLGLLLTTTGGYFLVNENNEVLENAGTATAPVIQMDAYPRATGNQETRGTSSNEPSTDDQATALNQPANRTSATLSFKPFIPAIVNNNTPGNSAYQEENLAVLPGDNGTATSQATGAVNEFRGTVVDDSYPLTAAVKPLVESRHTDVIDPMSIESVLNSFTPRKKKKLESQVYFTPTVSYRKLSENKAYIKSVSPANIPSTQQNLYDINNFVTHKPDFGFELGLAAKYPLTKNIKLRAGVQFNVNRYDIKIFNSSTQLATIRLNNRNGMDSVNRVTNYSNTPTGYKANWLENFYFQISAPVGIEFKIKGDQKVEFGIASTIQPTYVLGDRAYLISTDYKNYAEVPWLIRRWNVNTSLETFVAYSTGKLQWQVGPQVRYQLLSSFVKKYPVKENLFDFGLKVGLGLNRQ